MQRWATHLQVQWGAGPLQVQWGAGPLQVQWGAGPLQVQWGAGPWCVNCYGVLFWSHPGKSGTIWMP